jgi:hypothetical protein
MACSNRREAAKFPLRKLIELDQVDEVKKLTG